MADAPFVPPTGTGIIDITDPSSWPPEVKAAVELKGVIRVVDAFECWENVRDEWANQLEPLCIQWAADQNWHADDVLNIASNVFGGVKGLVWAAANLGASAISAGPTTAEQFAGREIIRLFKEHLDLQFFLCLYGKRLPSRQGTRRKCVQYALPPGPE